MADPTTDGPWCAHSRVHYSPNRHDDGTCSERWLCSDCGAEFIPTFRLDAERAAHGRARADLSELLALLPTCQERGCVRHATRGIVTHEPEYCDEHATAHNRFRNCDWADTVRRLTKGSE